MVSPGWCAEGITHAPFHPDVALSALAFLSPALYRGLVFSQSDYGTALKSHVS